ncbi:cellulose biosynthesis protein BcsE [Zobellella aerophila]|uniref:Cellulose biosynthesis protein BcsE n=1 Tax=Zobellella aerophila TaxID=870480 RepID=A0ABP6WGW5_9GAMM
MTSSFPLGIRHLWDELQLLQSSGLYWVHADLQVDALSLCRQAIGSQPASTKAALICAGGAPAEIVEGLGDRGPQTLPLFSLPASWRALLQLREDLMRGLKPRGRLLLLYVPARPWQEAIERAALHDWLSGMSRWLREQDCTLLIVTHGSGGGSLHVALLAEHRTLWGLARLRWLQDKHPYQVAFWFNHGGVSASQQLELVPGENGWQVREDSRQQPQPRNDEHLVLCQQDILEGAPALSVHWRLFDSNQALAGAGQQAQAATLVFALLNSRHIETLAREIHRLRCLRGKGIKLVIREMSASLRNADERLLLACGANLVVPHQVPLSRFLLLLEGVQGQDYVRHVPSDVGTLLDAKRPLRLKGVIGQERFCSSLIELMDHPLLPEDGKGVLVALQPVPGLRAAQSLTLCRIHREGDLATVVDDCLFLFLFSCVINDLDVALEHIFRLPVAGLFRRRRGWHQDLQILDELQKIRRRQPTEWLPIQAGAGGELVSSSSSTGPSRRRPQAIRLPVFREE